MSTDFAQVAEAALAAGATVLGEPPHYLLTAEQLAHLVEMLKAPAPVVAPPPY